MGYRKLRRGLGLVTRVGLRELFRVSRRLLWSTSFRFGLLVDFEEPLKRPHPARIPVIMQVYDPGSFTGFKEELARASGANLVELSGRQEFCDGGVRSLYVSVDESGGPIYAQWLVRRDDQEALHNITGDLFPQLGEREALLEGAYTFVSARGQGVMADGMAQLLADARAAGDRKVYTYVLEGNIPSLRGCANVGFEPDHLRLVVNRFGIRKIKHAPVDAASQAAWDEAVAPRKPAKPPPREASTQEPQTS
jgi:RimJ/RimL family protein N-acetyltransferase